MRCPGTCCRDARTPLRETLPLLVISRKRMANFDALMGILISSSRPQPGKRSLNLASGLEISRMSQGMAVSTDWSMFSSFALAVCLTRAAIVSFCLRIDSDEAELAGKASARVKECALASKCPFALWCLQSYAILSR